MKNSFILILLFLSVTFAGYSQATFTKTIDLSFIGGNNGSFIGNLATDVVPTINTMDGLLNVTVNKIDSPLSFLWYHWGDSGCGSKYLVLDQTNRYLEFRVKCQTAQTKPLSVFVVDSGEGACFGEKKIYDSIYFTLPEADSWTIVFLKIPPTTGGSQNIIDTIGNGFGWNLENGNYSFDYFKIGNAAIPPKPTIDVVNTKYVCSTGKHNVTLTGISIPNCLIDGLTIKAKSKSDSSFIKDVTFFYGGPCIECEFPQAIVQYSVVRGTGILNDSIIVILTDTIRSTSTRMAFNVVLCDSLAKILSLSDVADQINLYPNPTTGIINLIGNNIIKTEVFDITGKSQGLFYGNQIDLSSLPGGIYILNVCGKEGLIKKEKIILEK
jgi:hypothetical protein